MITVDVTKTSQSWDAETYFSVQAWCIEHIGFANEGWDISATSDRYANPRITFLFERDSDATMFILKWIK